MVRIQSLREASITQEPLVNVSSGTPVTSDEWYKNFPYRSETASRAAAAAIRMSDSTEGDGIWKQFLKSV